jgi:ribonucleoside-diphosphate reductase alpha chain
MQVTKRNGDCEPVSFDKITRRISDLTFNLQHVDPTLIAKETINALYDGISTKELDILSADICANKSGRAPDYNLLGGRILASNLQKGTPATFADYLAQVVDLFDERIHAFAVANCNKLQEMIDYSRDLLFDYFAMKTLERSYLIRVRDQIVERPQHLWMRVALQIHAESGKEENEKDEKDDKNNDCRLDNIRTTYDLISQLYITHATPTLFNSCTKRPQLSSCFLMSSEDNIEDIFKTISDIAKISKWAGGIGLSLSNIRAKGSLIRGTNGKSEGILPLCKTLETVGRYINQGGKRQGSIAVYLEPWHADILSFVELRKNTGDENLRARDLFLGLWVPDLFMQRVTDNGVWSLMCPNECPGLVDSFGADFEERYLAYERDGKFKKQIRAVELWNLILEQQIETGMPYMAFKDHVNKKNMQSHLGVIRNSNLCCEISLVSNKDRYAVCNLASICLPRFVVDGQIDYGKLMNVAGQLTLNLNRVIDVNFYPTEETRVTNFDNRPIGIGVQGLADVYFKLGLPFGSDAAREINKRIFEAIYLGAVRMSVQLAKAHGPYPSYAGSVHSTSKQLQFDLWGVKREQLHFQQEWAPVLADFETYGIRNSLLTALMPTASTSQIMGNTECFEPCTTNLYVRKTLAGEFVVVNRYLIQALMERGLWTQAMYEELLHDNGSVQTSFHVPADLKEVFKTAYELRVTDILKQAVDRSPFIDHQQSMNIYMAEPSFKVLASSHFYAWKNGLKTGMYYLRTKPAASAIKFGLDPHAIQRIRAERKVEVNRRAEETGACPANRELRELCDACSS